MTLMLAVLSSNASKPSVCVAGCSWEVEPAPSRQTNGPRWEHAVRHIKDSNRLTRTKWKHTHGKPLSKKKKKKKQNLGVFLFWHNQVLPCQRSPPWLKQIWLPWPMCFSPTWCDRSTWRRKPAVWRTSVTKTQNRIFSKILKFLYIYQHVIETDWSQKKKWIQPEFTLGKMAAREHSVRVSSNTPPMTRVT